MNSANGPPTSNLRVAAEVALGSQTQPPECLIGIWLHMQAAKTLLNRSQLAWSRRAVCLGGSSAALRQVWGAPVRQQQHLMHMERGVALALGAAALGFTIHWLGRGRRGGRRRHHHSHSARLLPRGRPLPAGPDELSLVSYNILCER